MNEVIDPAEMAARFIQHTRKPVFLTGKAGSGKTTFLRKLVGLTFKNCAIVAPTGIAAINAGGVTIHSLFQLPFGAFLPVEGAPPVPGFVTPATLRREQRMSARKRRLLQELELLIIDEVSMLRADVLDAIDFMLKLVRRQYNLPFGGVQVLFIGDLSQLPPVIKEHEWQELKAFYAGPFFFQAQVLQQHPPVYIELDKVYRQRDEQFVQLLNRLRENILLKDDAELLNTYYSPQQTDERIRMTTHNAKADAINMKQLHALPTPSRMYNATVTGEFPDNLLPLDKALELRVGARVMFCRNDASPQRMYYNGKLATVVETAKDRLVVQLDGTTDTYEVKPAEWKNIRYVLNESTGEIEEQELGVFQQYPLKYAWAITVHKSQGLTFEQAAIDVEEAFAPGQLYVALSRLTSLEGLQLTARMPERMISTNVHVTEFTNTRPGSEQLHEEVERAATVFSVQQVQQAFRLQETAEQAAQLQQYAASRQKGVVHNVYAEEVALIDKDLTELAAVSAKFLNEIETRQYGIPELYQRVRAGKEYFYPRLLKLREALLLLSYRLDEDAGVKQFQEEVQLLGESVTHRLMSLHKTERYLAARAEGREPDKKSMLLELPEVHISADDIIESHSKRKTSKTKKKKFVSEAPKKKRVPTQYASIDLWKAGNGVEEIAAQRNLSKTTIAAHLAFGIERELLSVEDLMPADKIELIQTAIREESPKGLKDLKERLPDDVTYEELKWVLAGMRSGNGG
jgi:hypothetical protein